MSYKFSGLEANLFTHWAILPALSFLSEIGSFYVAYLGFELLILLPLSLNAGPCPVDFFLGRHQFYGIRGYLLASFLFTYHFKGFIYLLL